MESELVPVLTSAGLIFYLMRWLKTFDWFGRFVKAFPASDRWVHRIVAGVGSLIATLGIAIAYSGDASSGWQINIAVPDLNTLAAGVWKWIQVFTAQQLAYDATRRPAAMPHDKPVT